MDMRRFRKCPFNAQHIVLVEEYEEHVRTCKGRVRQGHCMYGAVLRKGFTSVSAVAHVCSCEGGWVTASRVIACACSVLYYMCCVCWLNQRC